METTQSRLRDTLNELARERRLRQLNKTVTEPFRPMITLNGQPVLDFCNNDYLGLSHHPALIKASAEALEKYGTGTGGARLIGGTLDLHTQLETKIAQFKQTEAALVFNSGYQANVGVLSGLIHRNDVTFADRLNHASLVDGALLSRSRLVRYPHLDMVALKTALEKTDRATRKFIVTDTIFSMDGDQAPLTELFALAEQFDAWFILDEAHATGIFGNTHRSGLWETTQLGPQQRVIQIGTFSKALGSFGAYVAASQDVIDSLIQFSRSFVYSTSLPPAVIAANLAALELIQTNPTFTQQLWENIHYFHQCLADREISLPIQGPIIPLIIGETDKTLHETQRLLELGFYVQGIRPPTVPEGTSRLRITLTAKHTPQQISELVQALKLSKPV